MLTIAMIGLISLYAVLDVQTAVMSGATQKPVFSCIDAPHLDKRETLVDRAFARAVASHRQPDAGSSSNWHFAQANAIYGGWLAYSKEERKELMMPSLEALPACKDRN
ncbi:hypothetical protein ACI5KX_13670 [Erythrobacter sp. GH1-10]|uniref:hypothetical protein n=1 Tax=Erythrobacter sp. GH1-10 TaxID=3349334 RepID=UPI003877ED41